MISTVCKIGPRTSSAKKIALTLCKRDSESNVLANGVMTRGIMTVVTHRNTVTLRYFDVVFDDSLAWDSKATRTSTMTGVITLTKVITTAVKRALLDCDHVIKKPLAMMRPVEIAHVKN